MNLGHQLIAWRAHRAISQAELSMKARITRAYLVRLETGQADPSLSVLRGLATALEISVGTLLETNPPHHEPTRQELDQLARAVYHPHDKSTKGLPHVRTLAHAFKERREALGLYHPRKSSKEPLRKSHSNGNFAMRKLRALWGEKTWNALLQRIDKHAAFEAKPIS